MFPLIGLRRTTPLRRTVGLSPNRKVILKVIMTSTNLVQLTLIGITWRIGDNGKTPSLTPKSENDPGNRKKKKNGSNTSSWVVVNTSRPFHVSPSVSWIGTGYTVRPVLILSSVRLRLSLQITLVCLYLKGHNSSWRKEGGRMRFTLSRQYDPISLESTSLPYLEDNLDPYDFPYFFKPEWRTPSKDVVSTGLLVVTMVEATREGRTVSVKREPLPVTTRDPTPCRSFDYRNKVPGPSDKVTVEYLCERKDWDRRRSTVMKE